MLGKRFELVVPASPVVCWRAAVLTICGARPLTVAPASDRRGCAALASAMLDSGAIELVVSLLGAIV